MLHLYPENLIIDDNCYEKILSFIDTLKIDEEKNTVSE